ncbi:peptide deformylase, partial [Candidatus Omnitrophota bacterium]
EFDEGLVEFIDRMIETMFENSGIGLAAPQVGESKRIIVVDRSIGETEDDFLVLINPEIIETEGECSIQEGCLSVPGVYEDLVRPEKARVRYTDIVGTDHEFFADGMLARVILHEIDHLNGVLFVDRLSTVKRTLLAKTLKEIALEGSEA